MHTSLSYDTMPYPSKFFLQTHPDRLATIGTFYGMEPPPIETCRLLELGCGNGSNLIAHAYNLPRARFIGVDLSEGHIDYATRSAQKLKIGNVEFRRADVLDMTAEEYGEFDYIIAHGLFSWVPEEVRAKTLALYREMLAPNGIGYISYNAYPGAHYREMVREMMLYGTREETADPLDKVGRAITFLSLLAENATESKVYKPILKSELKRHFEHDAADIFHDDLAELYRPFYFYEFAALLAERDLQFLSEAELHAMSTGSFAPEVREFLAGREDIIEREQYADFFRGRIFRQTLFCPREVRLDREPGPDMLDRFLIASSLSPVGENPDLSGRRPQRFVGAKGVGIEIDHPLTKAALAYLGNVWGRAVPLEKVLREARRILKQSIVSAADREKEEAVTRNILLQIATGTDLVELHLFQPPADTEAGERPRVNRLARWQLAEADNVSTRLNLDLKIEDEISRRMLELLDGTRNRGEVRRELEEFIATDERARDRDDLPDDLGAWIEQSIAQLARLGMFDAPGTVR